MTGLSELVRPFAAQHAGHLAAWWAVLMVMGLVLLPVGNRLFGVFFDRGYVFSKVLGLAAVGYLVWLGSSLRVLAFGGTAGVIVTAAMALAVGVFLTDYGELRRAVGECWRLWMGEELLFLAVLVGWSFVRSLQPDIHGLEKFMDFGFVNSALRAEWMPPADMWFAGKAINYYYFGHFLTALLIRLSGVPAAVGYNLMIATLAALSAVGAFSLGSTLLHLSRSRRSAAVAGGLLAAALLTFGGNLHAFVFAYALPFAQRHGIHEGSVTPYWYPNATRYIGHFEGSEDRTIHEFPSYSFVVSDLHGHVLDIPFVLALLACLLAYLGHKREERDAPDMASPRPTAAPLIAAIGFLSAVMYMTNLWDVAVYLTVTAAVFAAGAMLTARTVHGWLTETIVHTLGVVAICLAAASPFILNFESFAHGVDWVMSRSPVRQLLVLWGQPVLFAGVFLVFLAARRALRPRRMAAADLYVAVLAVCAIGLVIVPEVVFVRDIYFKTHHRANTMFKLTYQAFIMFSLCMAYIAVRVAAAPRSRILRGALAVVMVGALSPAMLYVGRAVDGYYSVPSVEEYKGLDGLRFMRKAHPSDAIAIRWLNESMEGRPVVLESDGESYTDHGRISMATGLPTVLGWQVHEWLWRDDYGVVRQRSADVAEIYQSDDAVRTAELLDQYDVQYIVIGELERTRFEKLDEAKLLSLGRVILAAPETKIVQVERPTTGPASRAAE
ncbi:MAG: hypothetical protein GXY33_22050 [Phycisphaerae bacterium]|nr:hypothetical protein [Phycisphaerae bacterium]